MAGKSNKGRNKRGPHGVANYAQPAVASSDSSHAVTNGIRPTVNLASGRSEVKENGAPEATNQPKQGELNLFPVSVKTLGGEKLELQLNPGDSVMDVRQFLLDAPETCFFTCYDLLLHTKDGSTHQLEDYSEISDVADITTGNCSLEMVCASYDDRSIRAQVLRTRELLSLSTFRVSLSTSLALQHDTAQKASEGSPDSSKPELLELDGLGFMDDVSGCLSKLLPPTSKETKCVDTLVFSSFDPPPSYRRLVGDLIYLDVVTLEGGKFCITGTTRMFYVNSSTGSILDPRPHKAPYEATTLIGLLQKLSTKFKKAFRETLELKASAHPFENVQSMLPPHSWLGLYPVPGIFNINSFLYCLAYSVPLRKAVPTMSWLLVLFRHFIKKRNVLALPVIMVLAYHIRDAARAENSVTLAYGSELIGMQRDWNEELQSCREFPQTTPQERILRDRALYKVTSDFVDAAMNGAIAVINRCIPPINPTDPECFHMYVHNNIFFSFAVDSDIEHISRKDVPDSNSKLNGTASTVKLSESAEETDKMNEIEANASISEDLNGSAELGSDVAAEVQPGDGEQATYASANNDLRGTKAFQEADAPGLYNLAMTIIDYRGHRAVAQSVLPGILQGDKSDSLLYGSVDNGKKICWNEDFHSKVLEAAKRLHLKEHTVVDGSGHEVKLAAPVECKGIVGSDDRHYLLDLMRVTPRDANFLGPRSRFCILRPELVAAFSQLEAVGESKDISKTGREVSSPSELLANPNADLLEQTSVDEVASNNTEEAPENKDKEVAEDLQSATAENSEMGKQVNFNPNVFTEFKLAGSPEEIAADEEIVKKASSFLTDVVLPKFVEDLCSLEVSPMDGQTLTEALHAHGINVRYIGKVADGTKHLPHLRDLCTDEIAVRSAKHIFKDVLRNTEDHDIAPAISRFFNCFFGEVTSKNTPATMPSGFHKKEPANHSSSKASRLKRRWRTGVSSKKNVPSYSGITSEDLWSDIAELAKLKYQFEMPDDATSRVKKISVLRNLCQKVGITIAARQYDLDNAAPFQSADILDMRPVVKHSIPVCSEAKFLIETGKVQLAEGMLSEAYTLFSEAFSILQQVTGPMHREVANCCRYLAMILYHAGDMAGAIMQQHKELIINERCLGLDHPDTAHRHHMSRALLLLFLSSGPDHPDIAATFINVAMMFQDAGKMDTALRYLQEALKKNERLLGEEHIQTAVCYHALAIAFNYMGAFKLSHQHEKKTYDILVKQLGEEDSRTRDSQNWMKTFKMRELQMNAQKQKGQTLDAATAQKAINVLKALYCKHVWHAGLGISAATGNGGNTFIWSNTVANPLATSVVSLLAHPDLLQAFQAVATAGSGSNKSLNAAVINEALPRGRGVDERAARAAAEVRKKAAAKGLLRPRTFPVQSATSPLAQVMNFINSGVAPETLENDNANKTSKDADKIVEEGEKSSKEAKEKNSEGETAEGRDGREEHVQAPVGLGSGLGSLDAKKPKMKQKSTA
ncbi:Clustered mitochondria protein-like protein [Drosera capensis]